MVFSSRSSLCILFVELDVDNHFVGMLPVFSYYVTLHWFYMIIMSVMHFGCLVFEVGGMFYFHLSTYASWLCLISDPLCVMILCYTHVVL